MKNLVRFVVGSVVVTWIGDQYAAKLEAEGGDAFAVAGARRGFFAGTWAALGVGLAIEVLLP